MSNGGIRARTIFALRYKYNPGTWLRTQYFRLLGARIGKGTRLRRQTVLPWPHQLSIGDYCTLEHGIYFHYDGIHLPGPSIIIGHHTFVGAHVEFNIQGSVVLGDHCLIAAGCRFVDHNHGTARERRMNDQHLGPASPITLGTDVWLGADVIVLAGITIGDGAAVGAGSVVTKDIPPYEIWVGSPARKIRDRQFSQQKQQLV